jgi:hypothetical protein
LFYFPTIIHYQDVDFPAGDTTSLTCFRDDFVPPYYRIRNNLAAHAAPNWDDAAEFVYMARTTYNNMLPVIQHHQDPNDLAAMEEIRIELEDLDRYREEDLAENEGGADTDEDDISIEEYEEEVMLEDGVEEEAELAQVGNQEEVDAGTISLPICSASKDDNAAGTHVAENAGKK